MQPLVYYCRWQGAKLRLRGRDATAVWGELVYSAGQPDERTQRFHFDLESRLITLDTADGQTRAVLDEMGVVVSQTGDD
jgi:hypothetical protein